MTRLPTLTPPLMMLLAVALILAVAVFVAAAVDHWREGRA